VVFEFDWGEVAEGRVESYRIVEGLDVVKEGGLACFRFRGIWSWKNSVLRWPRSSPWRRYRNSKPSCSCWR
jgi:hypothetical protein